MKVVKGKVKNPRKAYDPNFEPRDRKRSEDRKWRDITLRSKRNEKYSVDK